MSSEFDCLNSYFDETLSSDEKRAKSVQAALIMVKAGINPDNPYKTLNGVTSEGLIRRVADGVQEALENTQ